MRKFIVYSRKGATSIMEVECEVVKSLEDPSVLWLQPGEYRARILAPSLLHQKIEKIVDGKKETVLVPDIWCWHAFYETVEDAKARVFKDVSYDMQVFAASKHRPVATDEEVAAAVSAVEVIML